MLDQEVAPPLVDCAIMDWNGGNLMRQGSGAFSRRPLTGVVLAGIMLAGLVLVCLTGQARAYTLLGPR